MLFGVSASALAPLQCILYSAARWVLLAFKYDHFILFAQNLQMASHHIRNTIQSSDWSLAILKSYFPPLSSSVSLFHPHQSPYFPQTWQAHFHLKTLYSVRMFFLQICSRLVPSFHSGLYSKNTTSESSALTTLTKRAALHPPLPFIISYAITQRFLSSQRLSVTICLFLVCCPPASYKVHKDRFLVLFTALYPVCRTMPGIHINELILQ